MATLAERDMILAYDIFLHCSSRATGGPWGLSRHSSSPASDLPPPGSMTRRATPCSPTIPIHGWDEIVLLPSRLSAEPVDREERQKLLDDVARQGFATGYSGLRIAKSGRRFWIEDGVVWQLIDEDGAVRGQAATFAKWRDA